CTATPTRFSVINIGHSQIKLLFEIYNVLKGVVESGSAGSGNGVYNQRVSSNKFIIGIDEVGRGALAGPVLVSAVMIPKSINLNFKKLPKLKDSKKLTAAYRETWFEFIKNHPKIYYATARVNPRVIDRINITKAANRAATNAFKRLDVGKGTRVLLDGGLFLNTDYAFTRTIIKGDEKINAIKLASIVAKVTRDRYMVKLHESYPLYNLAKHKGYGTRKHIRAIRRHGPSDIHRLTFINGL
ncbi:MAG: ribonuclease HII, partial [Patescibacteria group bacterium]